MLLTSLLLVLFDVTVALPSRAARAVVKQQDELLEEYDYIVAGGGTAGLTVADRLTESGECTSTKTYQPVTSGGLLQTN